MWFRDSYGTWHARWLSGVQVCRLAVDDLAQADELPVGAPSCSLCVRAMWGYAFPCRAAWDYAGGESDAAQDMVLANLSCGMREAGIAYAGECRGRDHGL